MFTGIVEETGLVESVRESATGIELVVQARVCGQDTRNGDSIAVNGCCLTVAKLKRKGPRASFSFDLLRGHYRPRPRFRRRGRPRPDAGGEQHEARQQDPALNGGPHRLPLRGCGPLRVEPRRRNLNMRASQPALAGTRRRLASRRSRGRQGCGSHTTSPAPTAAGRSA